MHHYIFIIAQLWLTSHPRSTVVLLDTGTPGTCREIFSSCHTIGIFTENLKCTFTRPTNIHKNVLSSENTNAIYNSSKKSKSMIIVNGRATFCAKEKCDWLRSISGDSKESPGSQIESRYDYTSQIRFQIQIGIGIQFLTATCQTN